ncbi:MAG TPA: APC family permease [Acidimicrobiales bacterium]|nr:APC family permease [Acidimicrobiales bacterium]
MSEAPSANSPSAPSHTLKADALGLGDTIVLAMASSGPTQSIAASLAALLIAVNYAGFLPILICFIPMIGIAIGYQRLNAWQPSAGATYSWVGRVLNPHAGFFAGWIMLMYYTIGTVSLTPILGSYTLSFFSNAAANNKYDVALIGSVLNIVVLVVAAVGIKFSARFQWVWAAFEYAVLAAFAVAAIWLIYSGHLHHVVKFSTSWLSLSGAGGFHALIGGMLIAIFLFSGWDTAAYVGEEVKGRRAGAAALMSVVLLFVVYEVGVVALQGVAPNGAMQAHAGNVLAFIGAKIGGGFWKDVMIMVVLGGTLASLQAAIVSAARISFAMGRDRVFPTWFSQVSLKYRTPMNATILLGLLNVVFLWGSTLVGSVGTALSDVVSTLGLMAAMFYLLTAVTAIWCYRRSILSSASSFLLGGVLPGLGAAFMAFVIIYELATNALNGVQMTFGFGFAALGLILSFISSRKGKADFYSDPTVSHGGEVELGLA